MASALLFMAGCLLFIAVVLLGYILVSKRTANVQLVWKFAVEGHRQSRWYMGVVVLAFVLAVASVICFRLESSSSMAKVGVFSEKPPNHSFKRTPDGAA